MERLLLLLALVVALAVAVAVVRWWARRGEARLADVPPEAVLASLGTEADGRWGVVEFSTVSCGECRVQDRILEELEPQARVLRVDAAERSDLARSYGVLTVPSTLVLDPAGRIRAVNHGLADAERLRAQMLAAEPTSATATR